MKRGRKKGFEISDKTKKRMSASISRALKLKWKDSAWKKRVSLTRFGNKNAAGSKNGFWKGGITKLSDSIRQLPQYVEWRTKVFQRDNWTCQTCKFRGDIYAHHIKEFSVIVDENKIKTLDDARKCEQLWNINNGVTLCRECHKLTDSYGNNKLIKKEVC